jgi:hypothetical protein
MDTVRQGVSLCSELAVMGAEGGGSTDSAGDLREVAVEAAWKGA